MSAFEHFFKPEVKNSGEQEFATGNLVFSNTSDTQLQGYIKGKPIKVSLTSEAIDNPIFFADCSCPSSAKGVFCKHIWAAILLAESKYPDFLDSKTTIEKADNLTRSQTAFKAKQTDYRKEQYQKQKSRAKDMRLAQKKLKSNRNEPTLPDNVIAAMDYFANNGFKLTIPIPEDQLNTARKKLSKVFHPDISGSHEEALTLNDHYDTLMDFIYQ